MVAKRKREEVTGRAEYRGGAKVRREGVKTGKQAAGGAGARGGDESATEGDDAMAGRKAAGGSGAAPAPAAPPADPSNVLLAQGLPAEASDVMLRALFGQYAGLADIRFIPERGLAFIEFSTIAAAQPALAGLHNFRLSETHQIKLTYAPTAGKK